MNRKARPVAGLLAIAAALVVFALAASPAKAAFGIADWQALTCSENEDVPAAPGPPPLPQAPGQCTDETEEKWFTHAAGHPDWGITDFTLNTFPPESGAEGFPEGFIKDIVVDLPEGLGVNPEAAPKCTVEQLEIAACPPGSQVGTNYFTVAVTGPPCSPCFHARVAVPVYNLVPFHGVPSMVGFVTESGPTFIVGALDPVDQHISFTIEDIHPPPEGPPVVGSRLVFDGTGGPEGNGTYLTMPSNCAGGQTTSIHVESHEGASDEADFTTAVGASDCEKVPFEPDIDVTVDSATDSPEPATVDVQMPEQLKPLAPIANSHLLKAEVTLPEGAGINPSLANDLETCTDAQFKKGTDEPIACPEDSRIGSVEVETAALDQDLGGDVYVAQPLSNDPTSGNQFRVFIHAFNERYGVNVRLIGHVFPDLQTGQLTVLVPDNPQAPFNSFEVHIDGGPTGALTTPDTCGPHTTRALFTPYSRPAEEVERQSQFTLDTLPGGGPCPATLADRPFNPGYAAGTRQSKAGAFTPFDLTLERANGDQEVKRVDVNLPPGMVARLRGLEYCPEASIQTAESQSGRATAASPPCPDKSFLGTATVETGSGAPFEVPGNVYLAGPYKGAPVSLVFSTPALAGPFDLGTVVVRVALRVDPETAEVTAVSDAIPHVFGGVKLDIRSIDVSIYRPRFTVNPTTCRRPFFIRSDVYGGGGNPLDPDAWESTEKGSEFQATDCRALRFEPKFYARVFAGKRQTRRAGNPAFRAIYDARAGDANLHRAAFVLPRSIILDQGHIRTVCTRVQLAADSCPRAAIYGFAKARSPLLDGILKGPVYLVSSDNELPDLLANLRGQVDIQLRGVISAVRGRLKTVFFPTPDVAVDKFLLLMQGGDRGLLVNSENLCARRAQLGFLNLRAQNSRRFKTNRLRLNVPACRPAARG